VIQFFSNKKQVNFFLLILLVLGLLSYELLSIDEDFLFLVSFTLFFYNFIHMTAQYAAEEFAYRKNYMYAFFNSIIDFKKKFADFFLIYFFYLNSLDLEYFAFESIFFFINNLSYRFYWNSYSESNFSYLGSEDTLFQISFDSKIESLLNEYFLEAVSV
jgi:hypothetical protein